MNKSKVVDWVFIIHLQAKSFIVTRLLPVLGSTDFGDANNRIARLAFIVYHDSDVHNSFTFGDYNSQASYITAIQSEDYHQPNTNAAQRLSRFHLFFRSLRTDITAYL